jgi:hypothetical protein
MTEPANSQWEFRVEDFGGIIRSQPKQEEFQALLNAWGEEGLDLITVFSHTGTRPACESSPNGR